MRRYDDPIDVRQGMVEGVEAPEQFVWRGRLWVVRAVIAHWVRTAAWWETDARPAGSGAGDLLAEHECWRVEAGRGSATSPGVFDLVFDWDGGSWRLVCSID